MAEETAEQKAAREEKEAIEKHAGRDHYYNPAKNPDDAYLAGVPMRDLSGDEWDGLTVQQRRDALYHSFWRLTPVPRAAAEPADESESGTDGAEGDRPAPPRRRAARVEVEVAPEDSTDGSNAVPSPALDAPPPNPVGALEPRSEVDN